MSEQGKSDATVKARLHRSSVFFSWLSERGVQDLSVDGSVHSGQPVNSNSGFTGQERHHTASLTLVRTAASVIVYQNTSGTRRIF